MLRRTSNASATDFDSRVGGQFDIDQTKLCEFRDYMSWFLSKTSSLTELCEGFPDYVSYKAHQNMSSHAFLLLVP
ncbi:MAG: hypothetical protein NTW52_19200 [Planctomycetota bacterium]|nr:hypothetical protein [Planctomycetota bacterium]